MTFLRGAPTGPCMERSHLGLGALALSFALLTSAVGCTSTASVEVPERVAAGSEVMLYVDAAGPLVSTQCSGQLECSRASASVESVSFDPPGLVEVVEAPELPASNVSMKVRAKRSGTVTVTFEGDFGSEERVMEVVAPASSDLYDANDPELELPRGYLLAPGQTLSLLSRVYDADGELLAGAMQTLSAEAGLVDLGYDGAWETITAGERLGDVALTSRVSGEELLAVRVTGDFTPTAIQGRIEDGWLSVDFTQDGYGMLDSAQSGTITVVSKTPDVCAPASESFDAFVWIGLDVHGAGTCTLELRSDGGLVSEISEEV